MASIRFELNLGVVDPGETNFILFPEKMEKFPNFLTIFRILRLKFLNTFLLVIALKMSFYAQNEKNKLRVQSMF